MTDIAPKLSCCKPYATGHRGQWSHTRACPDYPNQIVGEENAHPAGQNLPARTYTVTPVGKDLPAHKVWETHPPGHDCVACRYTEAWLDRDDDEFSEVIP